MSRTARRSRTASRTRYIRLGGSVVGRLDLDSSANPVAFLRKVKADGAQAIYYGGVTANRGCAIRAEMLDAFGTDATVPFLGGDGIAEDPACVRDAGPNFAGIYATVPAVDPTDLASATPVIRGFKSAYPNPADFGPLHGHRLRRNRGRLRRDRPRDHSCRTASVRRAPLSQRCSRPRLGLAAPLARFGSTPTATPRIGSSRSSSRPGWTGPRRGWRRARRLQRRAAILIQRRAHLQRTRTRAAQVRLDLEAPPSR